MPGFRENYELTNTLRSETSQIMRDLGTYCSHKCTVASVGRYFFLGINLYHNYM